MNFCWHFARKEPKTSESNGSRPDEESFSATVKARNNRELSE